MDYKKQYIKYKIKYLQLKKGGSTENNVNIDKKLEKLMKTNIEKLKKLKTTYNNKFKKGLKKKEIFELFGKIKKIIETIDTKHKYSLNEQYVYLENNYGNNNLNTGDILNNIILDDLINSYVYEGEKVKITNIVKYFKKNAPHIKLDNSKIKKYKTGELLGQGAYGKVFKLPNNRVLKIINLNGYGDPNIEQYSYQMENIISEIDTMNKLKNTNIAPKLYNFWLGKNKHSLSMYIEMEYKGITLEEWRYNNTYTENHKIMIKNKIKQLHDLGIIHNDLHSNNILVDTKNDTVDFFISDFGLSKTHKNMIKKLEKHDYRILFSDFNYRYDLSRYITLIIKILDIKLIV